jgi:hypothetical protein
MTHDERVRRNLSRQELLANLGFAAAIQTQNGASPDDYRVAAMREAQRELQRLYAIEDRGLQLAELGENPSGYAGRYVSEGADPRSLFAHPAEVVR